SPQNLSVDDSFILLFVNLEHRSNNLAISTSSRIPALLITTWSLDHTTWSLHHTPWSLDHWEQLQRFFSCPSCVSWLIQLPILQVRKRFRRSFCNLPLSSH